MHPCPPRAEGRIFSGHRGGRAAPSEALRRSSADSDGPVGGAILLHHDSRRDRGDGGPARCTFRTFRSARESRTERRGKKGARESSRARRPSRATWILFTMHDLHCRYSPRFEWTVILSVLIFFVSLLIVIISGKYSCEPDADEFIALLSKMSDTLCQ